MISQPCPFLQSSSETSISFQAAALVFYLISKSRVVNSWVYVTAHFYQNPQFSSPLPSNGLKSETGLSLSVNQNHNCPLDTVQRLIRRQWITPLKWTGGGDQSGKSYPSSYAVKVRQHFLYGEIRYQDTVQGLQLHFL